MSARIVLNLEHGLVESAVERPPERGTFLSLWQSREVLIVKLSEASLHALWFELSKAVGVFAAVDPATGEVLPTEKAASPRIVPDGSDARGGATRDLGTPAADPSVGLPARQGAAAALDTTASEPTAEPAARRGDLQTAAPDPALEPARRQGGPEPRTTDSLAVPGETATTMAGLATRAAAMTEDHR